MDPNPYSTHKAVMQSAVDYATYRKASNPHVQAGTGRKPSESSGFVYSEGSKVDWSTYGRQVEPETIEPQRLKAMKKVRFARSLLAD
jgi:ubiquitin